MFDKTKRFFRNLKLWFPILISDEQWDFHYIYVVLHHKLKITEDFFRRGKTHSLNIIRHADEIKEVREALERLIEDDYMHPDANEYYHKLKFEEINKQSNKEQLMIWFKEEEDAIKKDKDLVFNSLNKNINGWWD